MAMDIEVEVTDTDKNKRFWEATQYSKWYRSHRRFSFTANHIIELYDNGKNIPESVFRPFIQSLYCHSKAEEKMFQNSLEKNTLFEEHSKIIPTKKYSNDEKYELCKSLLIHMKHEEHIISTSLKNCHSSSSSSSNSHNK